MEKFKNFKNNLQVLRTSEGEDLGNTFIVSGIIDKFMIQFELSWKLLKELLKYEGSIEAASGSPRQIIKTAYQYYDFLTESVWLEMLEERNKTAHIYDENAAVQLVKKIISKYIPEFNKLEEKLLDRYGDSLENL